MKIKLDENLPTRLRDVLRTYGHDVDTVLDEQLGGMPDAEIWGAACNEDRLLITQDLDFSDLRTFAPGSHPGLLLVRLRNPSVMAITARVESIASLLPDLAKCFAVLTEAKLRIKRG